EAVQFNQKLVEGLVVLTVAAASPALATHGIDFVNEDDARSLVLGPFEEIAHPRRADTDEHFGEARTRIGKERHAGLSGDRAREQSLARSGRSRQQHTLGNAAAQFRKAL